MPRSFELCLHDPSGKVPPASADYTQHALDVLADVQKGQPCYRDTLGWHNVNEWAGAEWISKYQSLADKIRKDADAFVVIGIGGSNQAARAIIDSLEKVPGAPEIIWAGNSISAHSIQQVLRQLEGKKSVYIDIIAKNFETLEPGIGFRVLRDYLRSHYGTGWESRVIATGSEGSHLEQLCQEHGFTFLPFPLDVGGRFTALTPVGLLPIAVAGYDIKLLAQGASDMEQLLKSDSSENNPAYRYAAARHRLYECGYRIEMLSFFEPRFFRFSKWWVQLFGESEGKDGKGLFPAAGNFSEDLHSIGQFIQDGTHCLLETFIHVKGQDFSYVLKKDDVDDRFDYLNNMDFHAINEAAYEATLGAHSSVLPCFTISVEKFDEYTFGQLFYFFMFSCYLSGRLLDVNPFDQPGVEDYKVRMFRKLGKN